MDLTTLFKIHYGLFVLTTKDQKHNGCIVNTVTQLTDTPNRIGVTVNKENLTCETALKTGIMNVNVLSEAAPFSVFERFGFKSGKDTDKFDGFDFDTAENGLAVLKEFVCAVISLKVESTLDLGTHVLFVCQLTDARVLSDTEPMTYAYYHKNVKPKPQRKEKKSFVCKICGYVYEGEALPEDFVCPWCKHGAADFDEL